MKLKKQILILCLVVALFAAGGYFIGGTQNKGEALKDLINRCFPPKGE